MQIFPWVSSELNSANFKDVFNFSKPAVNEDFIRGGGMGVKDKKEKLASTRVPKHTSDHQ